MLFNASGIAETNMEYCDQIFEINIRQNWNTKLSEHYVNMM